MTSPMWFISSYMMGKVRWFIKWIVEMYFIPKMCWKMNDAEKILKIVPEFHQLISKRNYISKRNFL